jgi:hypothetical protein
MYVFVYLFYISVVHRYLYLSIEKKKSHILLILVCLTTVYQLKSLCYVEK